MECAGRGVASDGALDYFATQRLCGKNNLTQRRKDRKEVARKDALSIFHLPLATEAQRHREVITKEKSFRKLADKKRAMANILTLMRLRVSVPL